MRDHTLIRANTRVIPALLAPGVLILSFKSTLRGHARINATMIAASLAKVLECVVEKGMKHGQKIVLRGEADQVAVVAAAAA